MADAVVEISAIVFGMAVGGFLFALGNYLSFRFFSRLQRPLIEGINGYLAMVHEILNSVRGEKK